MNRRMFLSTAAAAPAVVPGRVLGRDGVVAPARRVIMGVIGCGHQGTGDMIRLLGQTACRDSQRQGRLVPGQALEYRNAFLF